MSTRILPEGPPAPAAIRGLGLLVDYTLVTMGAVMAVLVFGLLLGLRPRRDPESCASLRGRVERQINSRDRCCPYAASFAAFCSSGVWGHGSDGSAVDLDARDGALASLH